MELINDGKMGAIIRTTQDLQMLEQEAQRNGTGQQAGERVMMM